MKTNPYSEGTSFAYPGFFIDIEGTSGAGKSTQIQAVSRKLWDKGIKTQTTKEPSTGEIGKLIRRALNKEINFDDLTLQLLFTADRSDHLRREILPYLEKEYVVLTDRFLWSAIAYTPKEWRNTLESLQTRIFPLPDLSFFIKSGVEVSMARLRRRIEQEGGQFGRFETEEKLPDVWDAYLELAGRFPEKIKIVDGAQEVEVVTQEIMGHIFENNKVKRLLSLVTK